MGARDKYNVNIQCPKCGAAGAMKVSEADGYSARSGPDRHITPPDGFSVVQAEPVIILRHQLCNILF
jgi:hypothetical protein